MSNLLDHTPEILIIGSFLAYLLYRSIDAVHTLLIIAVIAIILRIIQGRKVL